MRFLRSGALLTVTLLTWQLGPAPALADPDTLWTIVHDRCVVDEQQHHDPAPCAKVDLDRGYVVFKDAVGARQYLLMPTVRIAGIESPELLDPGARNYFADGWAARSFVEQRAGGTIRRDWMSLAVNAAVARSQNQLHIHLDCLRADVHQALAGAVIGPAWAPLPVPLAGAQYWAAAVPGADLAVNPVTLVADGLDGARADMGLYNVVVVGAGDVDGQPGFVILANRADGSNGPVAGGELLQDHDSCPPPLPPTSVTAK